MRYMVVSPSFVLYEHLLFYMFPIAFLIAVAHIFVHEGVRGQQAGWLVGFFGIVAVLCAVQSTFHLVYYLAVAATLAVVRAAPPARIVRAALVPLLLPARSTRRTPTCSGRSRRAPGTACTWPT